METKAFLSWTNIIGYIKGQNKLEKIEIETLNKVSSIYDLKNCTNEYKKTQIKNDYIRLYKIELENKK